MRFCEFTNNGECFEIYTPKTPTAWSNFLFNDEYIFKCSQRLCGESFSVDHYKQKPVLKEEKLFFIKADDKCYRLCSGQGKEYSCRHYLYKTVVTEEFNDFTVQITVFVPTMGKKELWQIKIIKSSAKSIDVFAAFPFENIDYQGLECHYTGKGFIKTCFPYYIKYEEYEDAVKNIQYTYAVSNIPCTSYECNMQRFWGGDNPYSIPYMVEKGKGGDKKSDFEQCVAAFHHHFEEGVEIKINYMISDVRSEQEANEMIFPDFDKELDLAKKKWDRAAESFKVNTENKQLEYMTNYWLKKQVIYLTTHNRGGVYCPVRNQLQDALGYAMVDAKAAFGYALDVLKRQEENGFLKQWYMTDGSPEKGLCRINHSDAPVWLVICVCEIIKETGDNSLFDLEIGYYNSKNTGTIKEHLVKAVEYMCSQLGSHGLCLMKDGDWTDPVNGAGRLGRGESVWNTLALIYAIKTLNELLGSTKLVEAAETLSKSVNRYAWDKDRFIAGYDDNGAAFGKNGDKEGALFINTQTWALISGVCDDEKTKILKNTIDSLKTEHGYRLLYPAFSSYNARWGKISVKQAGATENGSVYSHATMFKAYADCLTGDFDAAMRTMEALIPHPEDSIQAPLYLPNYYFGLDGDNFGRSSCVFASGAPAWMLWIMKRYFSA